MSEQQNSSRGAPYDAEEIDFLRRHYGKLPAEEIADILGRPIGSIYMKARLLGISQSRPNTKHKTAPPTAWEKLQRLRERFRE